VRSDHVVVIAPLLDDNFCILETVEDGAGLSPLFVETAG